MAFQIIRNDITKVSADAIVNTANPEPVIGGGTDYAIHKAAGPELLEARKQIGNIYTGQSVATPAYQLSAKYVLHTVSPAWIDGKHHEEEDLRKAYDAALILAYELGCKSIAFPLMAAGTYGFPHDLALSVAIRAFTDFLLDHEMQIYLVLFNSKAFGIAGSIFDDLKSYIDDNYVSEKNEEEYLVGSFVGSIVGTFVYNTGYKAALSFCTETGVTLFGLVQQDYKLPDDIIEELGLETFSFDTFSSDTFEADSFAFDTFAAESIQPETLGITMLRRGVIGVSKIGFVS